MFTGGGAGGVVVRRYAISQNVAGSRPNEMNDYFSIYLILQAALGSEVYSAFTRNDYQK
jgi:hypothetical protein